jgi:hypothetical protein
MSAKKGKGFLKLRIVGNSGALNRNGPVLGEELN